MTLAYYHSDTGSCRDDSNGHGDSNSQGYSSSS